MTGLIHGTGLVGMTDSSANRQLWLRRFHEVPPGAPLLICFPHAGGSATWFYSVSQALAPDVAVLAVQYPGRQDRMAERAVRDITTLADRVADVLLSEPEHRPVRFFGHSMGAVVAFEVAVRLAAAGRSDPEHLFVSGRRAPTRHRDERVHLRDEEGVVEELKLLDGTERQVLDDPDVRQLVMPAVRADYQAIETYRYQPGPLFSRGVTALTGDSDPKTTLEEAGAWKELTTGTFALEVLSGGHFFLNQHTTHILNLIRDQASARA